MWITNAYAQTPAGAPGGELFSLLPIIVIFVLMYFLMIRPQMKRAKEHKSMLEALQKGDEVIASGLAGKVIKVGDAFVELEIAKEVTVQVQKQAIGTLLPKGTIK